MKLRHLTLAAALLAWPFTGAAAPGGVLTGAVVDGDGSVLEGVEVTASSDALMGTRATTTDAAGRYRLPALPPGSYGISFDLAGHQWVEYEAVQVFSAASVSLKVVMKRTEIDEDVVFSGGPAMDADSAAHARSFSAAELEVLPAGSRRGAGGAGPEWIDGSTRVLRASPPPTPTTSELLHLHRDGTSRLRHEPAGPQASLTDVRYVFAGADVERAGGLVPEALVFSRGGGESFHGNVAVSGAVSGDPGAGGSRGGQWAPDHHRRLGLSLGGAVKPESLWIFAAIDGAGSDEELSENALPGQPLIEAGGARDQISAFGRLSWAVADSHLVDLRLQWDRASTRDDLVDPFFISEGSEPAFDDDRSGLRLGLDWTGLTSDVLVISAQGEGLWADDELRPHSALPLRQDLSVDGIWSDGIGNGVFSGGSGFPGYSSEIDTASLEAGLEWSVAPGHVLALGVGVSRQQQARTVGPAGRRRGLCLPVSPDGAVVFDAATGEWQELQANCDRSGDGIDDGFLVSANPTRSRYQLTDEHTELLQWHGAHNTGGRITESHFFLQDRWTPTANLSLTAGVRLSASEHRSDVGGNEPPRLDLGVDVAPRVGLSWDFEGNGRSRFYVHWGRVHSPVPRTVARRLFGFEDMSLTIFDRPTPERPADLYLNAYRPVTPVLVDPATARPSFDEMVVGVDYELLGGLVVGVAASSRSLNEAVVDLSVDGGGSITITNQSGFDQGCSCHDVGPDDSVIVPDAVLDQRSVNFFAHHRFNGHWQFYTSVSWSSSEGNVDLGRWSEIALADSGFAADFTSPEALVDARGDLPDDRTWRFTTFGTYVWERGFMASAAVGYRSGAPLSKLGALTMGRGPDQRFVSTRGSAGRAPGVWTVDLRLGAPFAVGAGALEAWLEIGNLLGGTNAVEVDQRWSVLNEKQAVGLDADEQQTSDAWGTPLVVQQPRRVELGVRYAW